jgi:hypothetical protein
MDNMALYHGTNKRLEAVDLAMSRDRRDFGRGFYTTTIQEQAERWARSRPNDQVSLHTPQAIACLTLISIVFVGTKTYGNLMNLDTLLWSESAEFIVDDYYLEVGKQGDIR